MKIGTTGAAQTWYAPALLLAIVLLGAGLARPAAAADGSARETTPIGIIGAGRMGAILAKLWAEAGYPVMISARDPEKLQPLVQSIGHGVKAGTPAQAAGFGKVVVVAVPYGAEPQLGQE